MYAELTAVHVYRKNVLPKTSCLTGNTTPDNKAMTILNNNNFEMILEWRGDCRRGLEWQACPDHCRGCNVLQGLLAIVPIESVNMFKWLVGFFAGH